MMRHLVWVVWDMGCSFALDLVSRGDITARDRACNPLQGGNASPSGQHIRNYLAQMRKIIARACRAGITSAKISRRVRWQARVSIRSTEGYWPNCRPMAV